MNENKFLIIGLIAIVLAGIVGFTVLGSSVMSYQAQKAQVDAQLNLEALRLVSENQPMGGLVHNVQEIFSAGIKAGTSETAVINSSGQWTGAINTALYTTSTGGYTLSGAGIFSGAVTHTGIVTFSSTTVIDANAGSLTVRVPIIGTSTLTMTGDATFNGNGIFNADLTVGSGGTITFGSAVTATGTLAVSGAFTATADVRTKSPVNTGAIGTVLGTSTSLVTAVHVCDSMNANTTPAIDEASTLNLPAAELVYADCLTTNGDEEELTVHNTTASTTVVTIGSASTTLKFDGSTGGSATLASSSSAHFRFIRLSGTEMVVIMDQYTP